jgi:transcriptional regulator with XRE-family HTH domain
MEIVKVWTTTTEVLIETSDGRVGKESFSDYPKLRNATQEQRETYEVTPFGIHWPNLDEDLAFEEFFQQKPDNFLYHFFMEHPELNASAIARQLGISQSLFAQYISGKKKPSPERQEMILNQIRKIGAELIAI